MSKCMTIADESIDQKDTCTEMAPKEIVELILEEVLLSAVVISDKGCSRIGDFNVTEDFCQQYNRLPYPKDFEQVSYTANPSAANQESNVNSGKSTDRAASLVTAKENLELIIDSFVKKEERSKPGGECTIISEEVLADNELQIQNGQSHIEKNNRGKSFPEAAAREYFDKKDVIRDEKIEIQYYNEGKLSKIYVPLIPSNRLDVGAPLGFEEKFKAGKEEAEGGEEDGNEEKASGQRKDTEDTERPFKPYTTEEFRQVWGEKNRSVVGRWDGDVSAQREKVLTLMEELSSVQVFSDDSIDPNRPRACAFGEEDVKKIIKEIEEISFTQSHVTSEEFDLGCHPDGQGDADLESRSFTRSKDSLDKILKVDRPQQEPLSNSDADLNLTETRNSDEFRGEEEREVFSSEELILDGNRQHSSEKSISEQSARNSSEKIILPEAEELSNSVVDSSCTSKNISGNGSSTCDDFKPFTGNIKGEHHLQYQVLEEECLLRSRLYSDRLVKEDSTSEQAFESGFSIDLPPGWRPSESIEDIAEYTTKSFMVSTGKREMRNEYDAKDPPLWETTGNPVGSKQDQLTKKNFELTSERDVRTFHENPSDMIKTSRSMSDTQGHSAELDRSSQQSTVSLARLNSTQGEDLGQTINSFNENKSTGAASYMQEPDPGPDCHKNKFGLAKSSNDSFGNTQVVNDRVQNPLTCSASVAKAVCEGNEEGQKSLYNLNELDDKAANSEFFASSSTPSQTQLSSHSPSSSDVGEELVDPGIRSQPFKLHSQKITGINHEPDSQAQQECILTESEEALIDETESVLQIIEPQENSGDEDSGKVSFSLLCEPPPRGESAPAEQESESVLSLQKNYSSETEAIAKKVYSGMTTIGPLKNTDYDPKDLTVPNIDYGKMTRITSSRQLAKEIDLFGADLNAAASVKIVEDDSDNDISVSIEDGEHMEFTSLVNRDIASLTKVQKVREVMSYQPKPEDDFEDEDALPRPRLDLKDVESMTDERYKAPDVSIPLLSLEIGDSNGAEKELIENMGLVLSSLTNPVYYEEDFEEDNSENQKDNLENDSVQMVEISDEHSAENHKSETTTENRNEGTLASGLEKDDRANENKLDENLLQDGNTDSQQDNASSSPKYCTLGSVFRKASNRFIRRDGDLFLRNSKSLPRDTSKITATDSIRSILDDCQSSATNMLKKSKSLLKNTQSIFKSMSSSRVTSDPDSGHSVEKKKLSPSESDVSTLERKLSSFLRKEEFTKAKNLIKSKVEKTLKNLDSGSSTTREKVSMEEKDLRVAIRDEEKLRVDRMENFKKLLPKSPLVYKSQFVKSQMSMQNNSSEAMETDSNSILPGTAADDEQNDAEERSSAPPVEDKNDRISVEETEMAKPGGSEIKIPLQEKSQWLTDRDELRSMEEEFEPQQPEYIVMETIQGLPTTDLDSPSSDKENMGTKSRDQVDRDAGNEMKKTEASNSLQTCADGVNDIAPCFPELDEDKMATKTPSERKIKTKKKKLTARFRSFWCSAFGRVKTSPKKADHS